MILRFALAFAIWNAHCQFMTNADTAAAILAALSPDDATVRASLDALDARRLALVTSRAAKAGLTVMEFWRRALAETAWTVRHAAARAHADKLGPSGMLAALRRAICPAPGADFVLVRARA